MCVKNIYCGTVVWCTVCRVLILLLLNCFVNLTVYVPTASKVYSYQKKISGSTSLARAAVLPTNITLNYMSNSHKAWSITFMTVLVADTDKSIT